MAKPGRAASFDPEGAGPWRPLTCEGEEAQIPSGPEGDDPQLEAGYMLAVLPENATSEPLQQRAAPFFRPGTAYILSMMSLLAVKVRANSLGVR